MAKVLIARKDNVFLNDIVVKLIRHHVSIDFARNYQEILDRTRMSISTKPKVILVDGAIDRAFEACEQVNSIESGIKIWYFATNKIEVPKYIDRVYPRASYDLSEIISEIEKL